LQFIFFNALALVVEGLICFPDWGVAPFRCSIDSSQWRTVRYYNATLFALCIVDFLTLVQGLPRFRLFNDMWIVNCIICGRCVASSVMSYARYRHFGRWNSTTTYVNRWSLYLRLELTREISENQMIFFHIFLRYIILACCHFNIYILLCLIERRFTNCTL